MLMMTIDRIHEIRVIDVEFLYGPIMERQLLNLRRGTRANGRTKDIVIAAKLIS
jgi:hypothetical protein